MTTHPDRGRTVIAVACAAQFMVVLDVSVVNVALPSMQHGLGFSGPGLQWVVNAYALPLAGLLLAGGRLADLYGRRRAFTAGLALFGAASLVGGLATSPGLLIAARAAQGIGAAVLAPATLTLLTTTFAEGPRRTQALALWTALGVGGGTAGNLLGGVLTDLLSWRATLLINVPIALTALVATWRYLPADAPRAGAPRLDVAGAVLATGGLAGLAYTLARTATAGWADPLTLAVAGAVVVVVGAFVAAEVHRGASALIPLRLLRIRPVAAGNAAMLLAGACLNPMWFFLTLLMQNALHYTPLQTGLAFLPHTLVTMAVGAWLTPRLMTRMHGRVLIGGGALLAAAGFLWQAHTTTDSDYLTGIAGPALVFSLGAGLLNTPLTTAVTSGVATADAGAASGLMNTTKQVGATLGLAALITATTPALPTHEATAPYGQAFTLIAAAMVGVAVLGWLAGTRPLPAQPLPAAHRHQDQS
ncbi:MAG: MFS transporter [Mycolicibacterium sp.]|uniref:MFS transporter n=1 Tax=Mycolicibacterium sp. TaxID=2320850 RepID=UPI0035605CA5